MESTQTFGNLSTPVNQTTKHNPDFSYPCRSVHFETGNSTVPYIVNASLNVLLAIVAILANSLVFSAVRHSTSIRLPSKLLFCSLVLTDLGVGLVVQPQFVAFLITKVNKESLSISCFVLRSYSSTVAMFLCASLLTMTVISLDRYIALFFNLRYHEIVTTRRVCAVLAIVWSSALFYASARFWSALLAFFIRIPVFLVCFLVTSVAYIKIYRELRHQHGHRVQDQAQVQAQQQAGNTLDLAKYRRSASSMLWIYGLFILCYLPFFCLYFVLAFRPPNYVFTQCIVEFSITLVHLNSCLNPFLYCFRLPEMRVKVLQTLRKICCESPGQ